MALHWRKQLFVEEYVAHPELNGAEVAARAGYERKYAKNRAWELLNDPEVKSAIEHKQQQLLEKISLTAEDVVKDILAARQRCVEAGDGAWQTQGRLKCDELLGKYLGMWQEKVELTTMDEMTERLKRAREQAGIATGVPVEPLLLEAATTVQPQKEVAAVPPSEETTTEPEPEDWVDRLIRQHPY